MCFFFVQISTEYILSEGHGMEINSAFEAVAYGVGFFTELDEETNI